jgi:hypothetical protein
MHPFSSTGLAVTTAGPFVQCRGRSLSVIAIGPPGSRASAGLAPRRRQAIEKKPSQDAAGSTIFRGVIPFVATDLVRLVILIAFPLLATWLPTRMMAH